MSHQVSLEVGGRTLSIETGKVAKQADGAVLVRYSDTVVLVTAVSNHSAREGVDFFPLTIEYQEKAYAGGKIPGGFFKREGRPGAAEILTCRVIDRPLRPLFPEGYRNETQIIATVISTAAFRFTSLVVPASFALQVMPVLAVFVCGARVGWVFGPFIA